MRHFTIEGLKQNSEIVFSLKKVYADELRISCSDFYTVFAGEKVVAFGPERTAKGFTRIKTVTIDRPDCLTIRVNHYGIPTFDMELQPFFIGVELLKNGEIIGSVTDFTVTDNSKRVSASCKYSPQRGFVERYDFREDKNRPLLLKEIVSPKMLRSADVYCGFNVFTPEKTGEGCFSGFYEIKERAWLKLPRFEIFGRYDPDEELKDMARGGYRHFDYDFKRDRSGLIKANIFSDKDGKKAFLIFDEYLPEGKLVFGRSGCNDLIEVILKKGENGIISALPYTLRYISVITEENCTCTGLSLVAIQNDEAKILRDYGDESINAIANAARNTFMQNAFDIFTDCPGRERAGWLCDSFFLGIAERFFTGKRKIERNFLENFIVGNCKDVPDGMFPMCYPARHTEGTFIPNWAMWFVAELYEYYKDTKDTDLISAAKEKVFALAEFFRQYENEYGLLENLPSWVFVEWSKAGSDEYVKGVSFPTNMLYAKMLEFIGDLYDEEDFTVRSCKLVDVINELSFDGNFYCDNAERTEGKLLAFRDHVSETCQYYALFLGIAKDKKFRNKMMNEYSLPQKENTGEIIKSAVFIGNFLRIFWLLKENEQKRVISEIVSYFYNMSVLTGTIWEKYEPTASCNHGFAASLAYIIDECLK